MKRKNIFILILSLVLSLLTLTSCDKKTKEPSNEPTIIETYTVTWKNYNDTVLETDQNVEKGTIPTYDGATPTKTANETYTYTFNGWTPEITEVTKDITYTAVFIAVKIPDEPTSNPTTGEATEGETDNPTEDLPTQGEDEETTNETITYTVTWKNYDDTVLETDENIEVGSIPTYDGDTPTKAADVTYTYTFSGWSPEVSEVAGNVTYVAQYISVAKTYTITWKNYDGNVLETDQNVEKGATPTYNGDTPTKPSDENYNYTFNGWSPVISTVSSDVIYTAQFISTAKTYTITWKNYNGDILEIDENIKKGDTPTYNGDTPVKASDENNHYIFNGWSPAICEVNEDAIYTATYSSVEISESDNDKYTVTWKNYNGAILEIDTNVEEGTTPSYDGATPTKASDEDYNYTFIGWSPEVSKVTENVTYVAQYTSVVKTYTVTWENYNGDVLEIDENVVKGTTPSYDGDEPIKDPDDNYHYEFNGWSPVISEVTGDITYIAQYTSLLNTYTITWKNYNGDVLETDENVEKGATPSYDGDTPYKPNDDTYRYIFTGWTPEINAVADDAVYTATFRAQELDTLILGSTPALSEDGKTIQYGLYPQSYVSDEDLIATLETLTPTDINGWYLYDGFYYAKETATLYNNETYTFDDETTIVNGTSYWFKCEPIIWNVLSNNNGTYNLMSLLLLDSHNFYQNYSSRSDNGTPIYANNYEYSDIRNWLNDYFYNTAFNLNNTYISLQIVDNSASTTDLDTNKYSSNNTTDKVYLPSYQDLLNGNYGFETTNGLSSLRSAKTTDYARAKGAWYNTTTDLKYNGSYWTRSATSKYYYCAWNVNSGGYLSTYAVDGNNHSVRPCMTITLPN